MSDILFYNCNIRLAKDNEFTEQYSQEVQEISDKYLKLTIFFNKYSGYNISIVKMVLIILELAFQERMEKRGYVFGEYLDNFYWLFDEDEIELRLYLLHFKVYTIRDVRWAKGIKRGHIKCYLKRAAEQLFNCRLGDNVANGVIGLIAGKDLEWE